MLMGMRSNRNPHSLLMEMQNVQSLWKAVWQFLTKQNILLPCDSGVMLLGLYPKEVETLETYDHREACTRMFIAALFMTAKT